MSRAWFRSKEIVLVDISGGFTRSEIEEAQNGSEVREMRR
jgi:hypothetical protein